MTDAPPPDAARSVTPLDLEPIKEREVAATKGPWRLAMSGYSVKSTDDDMSIIAAIPGGAQTRFYHGDGAKGHQWIDNAEFIAAARQDIPSLIAEIEQLRALLASSVVPVTKRWTDVLCTKCGGNGVVKIPGGVSECPRCEGRCYEPDALASSVVSPKVCPTCQGRRWVMRSESRDHGNGVGSGGCWNEPCPDCAPASVVSPPNPTELLELAKNWREEIAEFATKDDPYYNGVRMCLSDLESYLSDPPSLLSPDPNEDTK